MMGLGTLVVHLAANIAAFDKDLGRAAHLTAKRMNEIQITSAKAGAAIGAALSSAATAAAVLVKQSINAADAMLKLSQSSGVSIGTLSELAHAANLSGVNVESLGIAMVRLNRNVSDAAAGTGESMRAFDALGISVKNADGSLKNADQVMVEVAERFSRMEDGAGKSALAVMIFGKAGAEMIPMLNQGAKGLKEMREEARALGLTLDTDTGKAAEQFNDNLTRLNMVKRGLANAVMQELLPSMNSLTEQLIEAAKQSDFLAQTARGAATSLRLLFSAGAIIGAIFKTLGDSIGATAAALVMIAQGEFKAAWNIMKEVARDNTATINGTVKTLEAIWDDTANSVNAKASDNGKKLAAPAILAANASKKAADEMKEAIMRVFDDAMGAVDADNAIIQERINLLKKIEELGKKADEGDGSFSGDEGLFSGGRTRGVEEAVARYKELQELRLSLLTDEQKEREAFERRIEMINQFTEQELEALGGRNAVIEQMTAEHEDRIRKIRERSMTEEQKITAMSYRQRAATVAGELTKMTAAVSGHSKALFEIHKIAAIATIALNLPETVSSAYKWGMKMGGPPLAVAFAALATGAQLAQLAAVKAQSFNGGGGAAPSLAGATAAPPVTPVDQQGQPITAAPTAQATTIILHGQSFSPKQVRELVEALFENGRDGGPRFA